MAAAKPKSTVDNLNLRDLANKLSESFDGISKKAAYEHMAATFADIIKTVQKGGEVRIDKVGTFFLKTRKARKGVNPQKPKERMNYPATTAPSFRCAPSLKKKLGASKKK